MWVLILSGFLHAVTTYGFGFSDRTSCESRGSFEVRQGVAAHFECEYVRLVVPQIIPGPPSTYKNDLTP